MQLTDLSSAEKHLREAEAMLRLYDLPGVQSVLGLVLHDRAIVAMQREEYDAARPMLEEALECLRTGEEIAEQRLAECYFSLGQLEAKLHGSEVIAELERRAMQEDGLYAATWAGQWQGDAATMLRLEVENAKMVFNSEQDSESRPATLTDRADIDLIDLLSLDGKLIERRIERLQLQIAGEIPSDNPLQSEDDRLLREAWRAALILQEVAVALLGKRKDDGVSWEELLESGCVSVDGMNAELHGEVTRSDDRSGYLIEVRVAPYEFDRRAVMEGSSVAAKVAELRARVSQWLSEKRENGKRPPPQIRWSLGLPAFQRSEVGTVYEVFRRGVKPAFQIGMPPLPPQQPLISLIDGEMLDVTVPLPDDGKTPLGRSFGRSGLTFIQQRAGIRSARLVPRIAEAFERLISSLLAGNLRIGYCQMPHGEKGYLDAVLGKSQEDPDHCNTFYWAPKGAATCGKSTCEKYWRSLQNLAMPLTERAEELAIEEAEKWMSKRETEWLWKEAKRAHPRDPNAAYQYVLRKLSERSG